MPLFGSRAVGTTSATSAALMSLPAATVAVPQIVNLQKFEETKNGDLSNFLKDRKALLLGDTEGYISISLREKLINHIHSTKNNANNELKKKNCIVFNGDISDYTNRTELSNADFEKRDRFFFLEFVKMINDYPNNIVSTIGNRDLNKLTVFHLIQYTNLVKWWKSEDKQGKTIGYKELMDRAGKLEQLDQLEGTDNKIPWLVKDMTNFFPYWNSASESIKSWVGWKSSGGNHLSLYERYLSIFGTDPSIGFMSAMNTLKGLMIEIGGEEGLQDVTKLIELENQKDRFFKEETHLSYLLNKYAAFVFIVYARILDPELSIESNKRWKYDGCLYKYLTSNPLIGYATNEEDKKIYLFSHGGIHSSFQGTQTLSDLLDIYVTIYKTEIIKEKAQIITTQAGGNIEEINNKMYNIAQFNTHKNRYIEDFYNFFNSSKKSQEKKNNIDISLFPTDSGFLLTALSCPIGKNKTLLAKPTFKDIHLESPIMSGFTEILKDSKPIFPTINQKTNNNSGSNQNAESYTGFGNNKKAKSDTGSGNNETYGFNNIKPLQKKPNYQIYNILGHSPTGFGYNFVRGKADQQIVICTDFSNSFLKDDKEYGENNFDNNNLVLYLEFSKNEFVLDGGIFVRRKDTIILQGSISNENLPDPIPIVFYNYKVNESKINNFDSSDIYEGSAKIYTQDNQVIYVNVYMVKGEGHNKSLKLVKIEEEERKNSGLNTYKGGSRNKLRNNNVKSKSYRKKTHRKHNKITKKINKRNTKK
jgi:hypothetical protein